jgi:integrase
MNAGGDATRLTPLLDHFKETPLSQIDQIAIDAAAAKLMPAGSAPTRNREIYTPVSAVLKHVGIDFKVNRPKGWRGAPRLNWLEPEQAFKVFEAGRAVDREFGLFLRVLCYTGLRLGEGLALKIDRLDLQAEYVQAVNSKTGNIMGVYLPPELVAELANHPRGLERPGEKIFRFVKCGRLYTLLRAVEKRSGVPNLTFHLFRHTFATWMRRYANLDLAGLLGTERWKDVASVRVYLHVVLSEESRKARLLPVEKLRKA